MSLSPIAIVGPTGTGKSELALITVEQLDAIGINAEIINADAMQLYRGMNIGTAKLTLPQRRGIPHHQLDVLDITQTASVAHYQQHATCDIEALLQNQRIPIIVGGSMLYIQSLLDNWSFPATDKHIRARWEQQLAHRGIEELYRQLQQRDPQAAIDILPTDSRRIIRALEVGEITGKPFSSSMPPIGQAQWNTTIIGLDCHTEILDQRLRQRTESMFAQGFVEEVKQLLTQGLRQGITASRALGYAQIITALDLGGAASQLAQAQETTFVKTRRYVRRQRSWFRRDHRIAWLDSAKETLPTLGHRIVNLWQERL